MIINNNLMAMNTHRQLGAANANGAKSMEKLSSGFRINRAGDDAAGLSISEKMRAQIRGLNQASRNAQDGISMIQTAEGGLNEIHSILQRMNELATQAATDTNEGIDRTAIQQEIDDLRTEIDRIADVTHFNNTQLLNGSLGVGLAGDSTLKVGTAGVANIDISGADKGTTYTLTFAAADGDGSPTVDTYTLTNEATGDTQNIALAKDTAGVLNFSNFGVKITLLGSDVDSDNLNGREIKTNTNSSIKLQIGSKTSSSEAMAISIDDMTSSGLAIDSLNVDSFANAQAAMDSIQTAIDTVSTQRSKLGAMQNRLEHTISNLGTSAENLQAAESRIRDVDMAKEMMEMTKQNILQQASIAMLAQANQAPQGVLQLLR